MMPCLWTKLTSAFQTDHLFDRVRVNEARQQRGSCSFQVEHLLAGFHVKGQLSDVFDHLIGHDICVL